MNILHKIWVALKKIDARASDLIASDSVRVFEIELLLFPVLVVLLASAALVCGGRCALWQWWTAVGMVIAVGWFHSRNTKPFYVGTMLYLFSLLVLWVACGISIVPLGCDYLRYHLPGIRLLIEGWNPVWQGRWELITAAFGIDPLETKALFILPNAKGVWYFDAVAFFFVGNPFNLVLPAYLALAVVAAVTVLRNFISISSFVRVLMVFALWGIVEACWNSIDSVVGFSGICLMSAMHKYLARKKWDWFQLLGYSFWMCVAKQTGLFHCFIFWTIFSVVILYELRVKAIRRLSIVASSLMAAVIIVGASPYFSSWKEFGHPLYPKCSVDKGKYPVYNMVTTDFLIRNSDAAQMSHIGAYVHAYVSPKLASAYYRWKLYQKKFSPWCYCVTYPDFTTRFAFFGCLLYVLFVGRKEDRFVATAVFLGTMAMPTEMIGFSRYCPWLLAVVVFAMPLLASGRLKRLKYVLLLVLVVQFSVRSAKAVVEDCGCKIAYAKSAMDFLEQDMPKVLYNEYVVDTNLPLKGPAEAVQDYFDAFFAEKNTRKRVADMNRATLGNIKLLARQSCHLKGCRIVDCTKPASLARGGKSFFYDNSFKVGLDETFPKLRSAEETVLLTLPELLWRRVTGRFAFGD